MTNYSISGRPRASPKRGGSDEWVQILRRKEKDDRNPLCTRRKQKVHTGSDVARVTKVRVPNRATRVGSENWILEEEEKQEQERDKERDRERDKERDRDEVKGNNKT